MATKSEIKAAAMRVAVLTEELADAVRLGAATVRCVRESLDAAESRLAQLRRPEAAWLAAAAGKRGWVVCPDNAFGDGAFRVMFRVPGKVLGSSRPFVRRSVTVRRLAA